ncbi:Protein of uncharacterised function (DUF2946) [Citrobacter koseri]|nr:Protein of uncharacterised function (DUF2946) [Citrobacter koseri]
MVIGTFRQPAYQRNATWLAMFAILLIVVAPLISVSLQKDPMSAMPGMHHDMSMMAEHAGHHGSLHQCRCLSITVKRAGIASS